MELSLNDIFNLLKGFPGGLTTANILKLCNLKKSNKNDLKKILKRLTSKNKIFKKNNRYLAKTGFIKNLNSPMASSKKQRKGEYNYQDGEHLIVCMDSKDDVYAISKKTATFLMDGDVVIFSLPKKLTKNSFADIIRVTKRKHSVLSGTIQKSKDNSLYFAPTNDKIRQTFAIKNPNKTLQVDQYIKLKISSYPSPGVLPQGLILSSVVEPIDEQKAIDEIIKREGIKTEFPDSVIQEVKQFPNAVRYSQKDGRKDLRDLPFVTIDGMTAKDFDDAIYVKEEPEGYRLYVSIADVSDYVKEDSALDEEAVERGTSVYLPDYVIPMLPEELSNHLCSLKEGYNRRTLTCEILMNKKGKTLSVDIYPSMIKTVARLTYEEVDDYLYNRPLAKSSKVPSLKESIDIYLKLSKILIEKRTKRGCFNFTLPDTYFKWSGKDLEDIQKCYQTLSQKLIEQFMLEANEAVAEYCHKNKLLVLYRNHEDPDQGKVNSFLEVNKGLGIKVGSSKNALLDIFNQIQDEPNKDWLEMMLIRSMSQANYGVKNLGHYGLAAKFYCHFTSPIRRYPDLIVHRALKHFWRTNKIYKFDVNLGSLTSQRERTAVTIERSATKIKKMNFMHKFIGKEFVGKISGINPIGVYVELDAPFVEGFIPMIALKDDFYYVNVEKQILKGKRTNKKVTLGNLVRIIVQELDPKHKAVNFEWCEWVDK